MNSPLRVSLLAAALLPLASQAAEYASVISATPVTAAVGVPRQVCSNEQRIVQPQPSGAGAVIGAVAGGLLGHTVGAGFGRAAATGIGAVAGAAIGNSVEANAYPPAAVPVQRCQTVASTENRVVGYDVVYEYNGRRYSTRMDQDPGPEIAIDVRPSAGYPPEAGPQSAPPGYVQEPAPLAYGPGPAYYAPAPVYVTPSPAYYIAPAIAVGVVAAYWRGHHGRRHGWR